MRQLEYTIGGIRVQSKEFTEVFAGTSQAKIRLANQMDCQELLIYSIAQLMEAIDRLNTSIDTLSADIRRIRVGNETFIYAEKVDESDEVDAEELLAEEGEK